METDYVFQLITVSDDKIKCNGKAFHELEEGIRSPHCIVVGAIGRLRTGKSTSVNLMIQHISALKNPPQCLARDDMTSVSNGLTAVLVLWKEMKCEFQTWLTERGRGNTDIIFLDCEGVDSGETKAAAYYALALILSSAVHIHVQNTIDGSCRDSFIRALQYWEDNEEQDIRKVHTHFLIKDLAFRVWDPTRGTALKSQLISPGGELKDMNILVHPIYRPDTKDTQVCVEKGTKFYDSIITAFLETVCRVERLFSMDRWSDLMNTAFSKLGSTYKEICASGLEVFNIKIMGRTMGLIDSQMNELLAKDPSVTTPINAWIDSVCITIVTILKSAVSKSQRIPHQGALTQAYQTLIGVITNMAFYAKRVANDIKEFDAELSLVIEHLQTVKKSFRKETFWTNAISIEGNALGVASGIAGLVAAPPLAITAAVGSLGVAGITYLLSENDKITLKKQIEEQKKRVEKTNNALNTKIDDVDTKYAQDMAGLRKAMENLHNPVGINNTMAEMKKTDTPTIKGEDQKSIGRRICDYSQVPSCAVGKVAGHFQFYRVIGQATSDYHRDAVLQLAKRTNVTKFCKICCAAQIVAGLAGIYQALVDGSADDNDKNIDGWISNLEGQQKDFKDLPIKWLKMALKSLFAKL